MSNEAMLALSGGAFDSRECTPIKDSTRDLNFRKRTRGALGANDYFEKVRKVRNGTPCRGCDKRARKRLGRRLSALDEAHTDRGLVLEETSEALRKRGVPGVVIVPKN